MSAETASEVVIPTRVADSDLIAIMSVLGVRARCEDGRTVVTAAAPMTHIYDGDLHVILTSSGAAAILAVKPAAEVFVTSAPWCVALRVAELLLHPTAWRSAGVVLKTLLHVLRYGARHGGGA